MLNVWQVDVDSVEVTNYLVIGGMRSAVGENMTCFEGEEFLSSWHGMDLKIFGRSGTK
jgi:hypothetical protein